jgi:hypothetical protein
VFCFIYYILEGGWKNCIPISYSSFNICPSGNTRNSRSQWRRVLRHELSLPARTLGSWVLRHGCLYGRAIAEAVSRWLPTVAARVRSWGLVKWDLWWTKWRRGRFSPSTSVSPAIHSTKFSILTTITRGRYNRPVSGRRAEWTQFGLHPPLCKLKKI